MRNVATVAEIGDRGMFYRQSLRGIILQIARKSLMCGGGVEGRFTAKLLTVQHFMRPSQPHQRMSAFGGEADIDQTFRNVRF